MNLNHIAKKPFFDLFYKTPCMPTLVRLAFHDAGSYVKAHNKWAASASLRYEEQLSLSQNKGLRWAIEEVLSIQKQGNHITELLSVADLIQLGGYCAVEYCGGPQIPFKMGRKDCDGNDLPEEGLIPRQTMRLNELRESYERQGFTPEEMVALMGVHTIQMARAEVEGFEGRWTKNPLVFDNSYYKEILSEKSKYLRLEADEELARDPELRPFVERFAEDEEEFFRKYGEAHQKLSENGQKELLGQY